MSYSPTYIPRVQSEPGSPPCAPLPLRDIYAVLHGGIPVLLYNTLRRATAVVGVVVSYLRKQDEGNDRRKRRAKTNTTKNFEKLLDFGFFVLDFGF